MFPMEIVAASLSGLLLNMFDVLRSEESSVVFSTVIVLDLTTKHKIDGSFQCK